MAIDNRVQLLKYKRLFGLIGMPLNHSFSKRYFNLKFKKEQLENYGYELFPLDSISHLHELIAAYPNLRGLNVTIPYKKAVCSYLDVLEGAAKSVGSVNTIDIHAGQLKGYNTDVFGFHQSLLHCFETFDFQPEKALVLGTGGAAASVDYVLKNKFKMQAKFVSRNPGRGVLSYENLDEEIITSHTLIVNATPLGMMPDRTSAPAIPYQFLNNSHLLYDLVYNPKKTLFLSRGERAGCKIKNGLEMLYLQAEKSWEIWKT